MTRPICPETIEGLEELENLIPMCRKELYVQAKARIESGVATSVAEASRQIGEETGRKPESIRKDIRNEQNAKGGNLSHLAGTSKYAPKVIDKKILEMATKIKKEKRTAQRETNKSLKKDIPIPQGKYDVIVVDLPWPMQKIERDVAPNQVSELDYPTMDIEEIEQLEIPSADNCHLFMWATQKFLPMAFNILNKWDFKYVCCFCWHKPGGFQPFGLPQYNWEPCLYARKGTPKFRDLKAFSLCFNAGRGKHSEKPNEFYEMVERVTGGKRLDLFNRRDIAGFDGWGNESNGKMAE